MGKTLVKIFLVLVISRGAAESAALRMDTADPGSLFVPEKIQGGTAQEEKIHCGTGRSFSVVTWYLRLRQASGPAVEKISISPTSNYEMDVNAEYPINIQVQPEDARLKNLDW